MLRTLPEKIDAQHTALLVVDVQNDFCHEEGFLAKQGWDVSPTHQMIPKLIHLLSEARKGKLTIIFIRQTSSESTLSPVSRELMLRAFHQTSQLICQEGSWGTEFYKVAPLPGELMVTKHRYSALADTNLNLILRSMGIKSLIITGVATNACVESTARDGFMKDYYVIVVSDCTATQHIEDQQATLRNIRNFFGTVASSDEIIAIWGNKHKRENAR